MIMIERTTQNKIAKNALWDYGVERRGGANSDSNVSAKAAVQDSNQTKITHHTKFNDGIRDVDDVTLVRTYQRKPPSKT